MRKLLLLSLLAAAGQCAFAGAIPLYSNTTTDTGFTDGFGVNGLVEAGDQITLEGGTTGYATSAITGLFNSGATGTINLTLNLYSLANGGLDSQLYSATQTGLVMQSGVNTFFTFANINTAVPANLIWTLAYTTVSGVAPELLSFDPPAFGNSDNTTVWWDTGTGLQLTTPGYNTENYYFALNGTATPEPGVWLLTLTGLTVVGAARLRFRRANVSR